MKIVRPSVELINPPEYKTLLSTIEQAGRVCYKSENKIKEGSAEKFIKGIIASGHESVLEHGSITARIVCDRGVSHELVRHRLASYSQTSTRYCNYSNERFGSEIEFVAPWWYDDESIPDGAATVWRIAMRDAKDAYMQLIDEMGMRPEAARAVLPNSLKTEVVMTANIREWRHMLKLRLAPAAHPDMRIVANLLLAEMATKYPVFFEDVAA